MGTGNNGGAGLQCAKCFYPGTGQLPGRSGVISSDRTRFLADFAESGRRAKPSAPAGPDED